MQEGVEKMKNKKYIIREKGLLFIKKYALPTLGLSVPLSDDDFEKIIEYAMECEMNVIDDNGNDLPIEDVDECDLLGDNFGTEISNHINEEIDFDDLNFRLQ